MKVFVCLLEIVLAASVPAFAQTNSRAQHSQQQQELFGQDPFDVLQYKIDHPEADRRADNSRTQRSTSNSSTTVAFQQLKHKPSAPSVKEHNKGMKDYSKHHYESALSHLQNAIQLDPDFADAHNDLGVVLAKVGSLAEAVEQFQKAIALAPEHSTAVPNLCVSLFLLRRYQQVIPLARTALRRDPTLTYVRYALAMSIVAAKGDRQEALDNLEQAAPKFPEARLTASAILAQTGQRDQAAQELEQYLRSIPKTDATRHDIEIQLAVLRR